MDTTSDWRLTAGFVWYQTTEPAPYHFRSTVGPHTYPFAHNVGNTKPPLGAWMTFAKSRPLRGRCRYLGTQVLVPGRQNRGPNCYRRPMRGSKRICMESRPVCVRNRVAGEGNDRHQAFHKGRNVKGSPTKSGKPRVDAKKRGRRDSDRGRELN